jgi:hypothetical protein
MKSEDRGTREERRQRQDRPARCSSKRAGKLEREAGKLERALRASFRGQASEKEQASERPGQQESRQAIESRQVR